MKNEYRVPAICVVCGKGFKARYTTGGRAKTCTPKKHVCKKGDKLPCVEKCCRSQYRVGASAASMDNAIDPTKLLSEEEYAKTIKATYRVPNPEGIALRFVAETGCRLGECLLVRKESVEWGTGARSIVKIPTLKKRAGRPERSVHLKNASPFVKEFKEWWASRKPRAVLFPVARRTLQHRLETILDRIKPVRGSLVHIFRHTRASKLMKSGASMAYLVQQMGWSSIELAKIYAHVDESELDKLFERL